MCLISLLSEMTDDGVHLGLAPSHFSRISDHSPLAQGLGTGFRAEQRGVATGQEPLNGECALPKSEA